MRFCRIEFSHSEIPGSKLASSSPGLIAGNHVLHRLVVPRHPSYALKYLTILCSTQGNFCKSLGFLLYDHFDTYSLILDILTCISDALLFFYLLQNCVESTRYTRVHLINSLPIFVVKLHLIISMIGWFSVT